MRKEVGAKIELIGETETDRSWATARLWETVKFEFEDSSGIRVEPDLNIAGTANVARFLGCREPPQARIFSFAKLDIIAIAKTLQFVVEICEYKIVM